MDQTSSLASPLLLDLPNPAEGIIDIMTEHSTNDIAQFYEQAGKYIMVIYQAYCDSSELATNLLKEVLISKPDLKRFSKKSHLHWDAGKKKLGFLNLLSPAYISRDSSTGDWAWSFSAKIGGDVRAENQWVETNFHPTDDTEVLESIKHALAGMSSTASSKCTAAMVVYNQVQTCLLHKRVVAMEGVGDPTAERIAALTEAVQRMPGYIRNAPDKLAQVFEGFPIVARLNWQSGMLSPTAMVQFKDDVNLSSLKGAWSPVVGLLEKAATDSHFRAMIAGAVGYPDTEKVAAEVFCYAKKAIEQKEPLTLDRCPKALPKIHHLTSMCTLAMALLCRKVSGVGALEAGAASDRKSPPSQLLSISSGYDDFGIGDDDGVVTTTDGGFSTTAQTATENNAGVSTCAVGSVMLAYVPKGKGDTGKGVQRLRMVEILENCKIISRAGPQSFVQVHGSQSRVKVVDKFMYPVSDTVIVATYNKEGGGKWEETTAKELAAMSGQENRETIGIADRLSCGVAFHRSKSYMEAKPVEVDSCNDGVWVRATPKCREAPGRGTLCLLDGGGDCWIPDIDRDVDFLGRDGDPDLCSVEHSEHGSRYRAPVTWEKDDRVECTSGFCIPPPE